MKMKITTHALQTLVLLYIYIAHEDENHNPCTADFSFIIIYIAILEDKQRKDTHEDENHNPCTADFSFIIIYIALGNIRRQTEKRYS